MMSKDGLSKSVKFIHMLINIHFCPAPSCIALRISCNAVFCFPPGKRSVSWGFFSETITVDRSESCFPTGYGDDCNVQHLEAFNILMFLCGIFCICAQTECT